MPGQIIQRGDRKYLVRWFIGRDAKGKRKYGSKTVHGTKKAAQKQLRAALGRQDRGLIAPSPSSIPRLADYVKTWEKQEKERGKLRDRTRRNYRKSLDRYVIPALGTARLDGIHVSAIEALVVTPLVKAGHHRTARLTVAALSRVMKTALKDPTMGLAANPCLGVEIPAGKRLEIKPLDAKERAAFREAIAGTPHEVLWLLMMLTGLGPGEALALGWEHLDLDAGALRVARTLDCKKRVLIDGAKRPTRLRQVPLAAELRQKLRELWMERGRPAEGLVFHDIDGRPLDLDNLRARHFKPALIAAKIDPETRPFRIYDLRHGFATAALEAGADPVVVRDLMGHSTVRTAQDTYQHTSPDRLDRAARRIADRLN
ncbi:MAG: site-specific integrase [bacterium]|nr:site-specific integrase [bacterium]